MSYQEEIAAAVGFVASGNANPSDDANPSGNANPGDDTNPTGGGIIVVSNRG